MARGSRKFAAAGADGQRWFVKAVGLDQRDADLLYRGYRAVRLRNVGDTRPEASLFQAVEHQALVGVMAERADVLVPVGSGNDMRAETANGPGVSRTRRSAGLSRRDG